MASTPPLPIDDVLPDLARSVRESRAVVLQAPPGAGKTTKVPLALLAEDWLARRRIVMLEPRRIAARAAAHRMAAMLGERVGETVGYRMRMDTRVGPSTRIEVVTEGVLTRMVLHDPSLEGVGLVIFDEYHERSLNADLGLALTLQSRELLRDDLRLLVMSATLDGNAVGALVGGALVTSAGRAHPVTTIWSARRPDRVEDAVPGVVRRALDDHGAGDVLVFLPGAAEIRRVERALRDLLAQPDAQPRRVEIHSLHGSLPAPAQDAAIRPAAAGVRKVVLSTSIAETSLTIEGVRIVVDSGLARVPRFSPRSGMTRLETVRVSRAAADQRRGRAGRLGPGVCYRLWPESEDDLLAPHRTPEILEADLAPLALELASAGVRDPNELRWLDLPPRGAMSQARELLVQLGALDDAGRVTEMGRRMTALPMHPRLARMVVAAISAGAGATGCALAALLADRDPIRGQDGPPDADVRLRLDLVRGERETMSGAWIDTDAIRRARMEASRWSSWLGVGQALRAEDAELAGVLLSWAYPDRIAQRRAQPGRFLLRNGRGAALPVSQSLAREPFLVAAELDGRDSEARIHLAAPITASEVVERFASEITVNDSITWNDETLSVVATRQERLGALLLREGALHDPDATSVLDQLVAGIRRAGLEALPWSEASRSLRLRVAFLRTLDDQWPDLGDEPLATSLYEWLGSRLHGVRRIADIDPSALSDALRGSLPWDRQRLLDELAPTHVVVPSGSRIPVDYTDPASPSLAVRLQELFGLAETPTVAGGRVPLTLQLLSPAHRPVQVTRDLAGFWRTSYFDVRKDLRGRYPKHQWPDDPLTATPTAKAKRRQ